MNAFIDVKQGGHGEYNSRQSTGRERGKGWSGRKFDLRHGHRHLPRPQRLRIARRENGKINAHLSLKGRRHGINESLGKLATPSVAVLFANLSFLPRDLPYVEGLIDLDRVTSLVPQVHVLERLMVRTGPDLADAQRGNG